MMVLYIVLPWIQKNLTIRQFINFLDKENIYTAECRSEPILLKKHTYHFITGDEV